MLPVGWRAVHSIRSRHWQEAGLRTFSSAVAGGLSTQSGRWPGPLRTRQGVTGRFARKFPRRRPLRYQGSGPCFLAFNGREAFGTHAGCRSSFRRVRLLSALFSRAAGQGIEGRVRRTPPERRGRLLSGSAKRQVPRTARAGADGARFANGSRTTGEFNGCPIDSLSVGTMVLRHEADGWRITHIHWSSRAAR